MANINNRDDYQKWYEEYVGKVNKAQDQALGAGSEYVTILNDWEKLKKDTAKVLARFEAAFAAAEKKLKDQHLESAARKAIQDQKEQLKNHIDHLKELNSELTLGSKETVPAREGRREKWVRYPVTELLERLEVRGAAVKPRNFTTRDLSGLETFQDFGKSIINAVFGYFGVHLPLSYEKEYLRVTTLDSEAHRKLTDKSTQKINKNIQSIESLLDEAKKEVQAIVTSPLMTETAPRKSVQEVKAAEELVVQPTERRRETKRQRETVRQRESEVDQPITRPRATTRVGRESTRVARPTIQVEQQSERPESTRPESDRLEREPSREEIASGIISLVGEQSEPEVVQSFEPAPPVEELPPPPPPYEPESEVTEPGRVTGQTDEAPSLPDSHPGWLHLKYQYSQIHCVPVPKSLNHNLNQDMFLLLLRSHQDPAFQA